MRTLLLPGIALTTLCTSIWLLNDQSVEQVALEEASQERTVARAPERDLPQPQMVEPLTVLSAHVVAREEMAAPDLQGSLAQMPQSSSALAQADLENDYDVLPIQEPEYGVSVDFGALEGRDFDDAPTAEQRHVALLDEVFNSEPYDSQWAAATESTLMHSFAEARLEGSQLTAASCRSTLCRIDVVHADKAAEGRFLAGFASTGEFVSDQARGFYTSSVDYNGMPRTVFFWARAGHELSAMEAH